MRLSFVVPLVAALALTGCNKGGSGSGSSTTNGNPVAAQQAAASFAEVHFQPGRYESKVEVKAFDMPGVPATAFASMKQAMAAKPLSYCLTPEDAAKGIESMKKRMSKGKCQFNRFDAAGGKLDTKMTCQMGAGTMHAVGHGTYSDTGNVMNSTVDLGMPGGRKMHIEEVTTTNRVGDCTK